MTGDKDLILAAIQIPQDLDTVLDNAWHEAQKVSGYLGEAEARFLGLLAACTPAQGAVVEIGSFKGRSTVMLAKVASRYALGPVVAIDPHNSPILLDHQSDPQASSYDAFLASIRAVGLSDDVEPQRAHSADVARSWSRPIRFLWIDGDHTYAGAKNDLDGFLPHLVPDGIVAFHDALNNFPGPIRVFVEDVLRSDRFGPAGFVHSIAWAQFRPQDGHQFQDHRAVLARRASRLLPFVQNGRELRGLKKRLFKFYRFCVPQTPTNSRRWASFVDGAAKP